MFDKIKKNRLIKKIKKSNKNSIVELYESCNSSLKNDEEICNIIFTKDNTLLFLLPIEYQLKKGLDYIDYMSEDSLSALIEKNPENNVIKLFIKNEKRERILYNFLKNNLNIINNTKYNEELITIIKKYDNQLLIELLNNKEIKKETKDIILKNNITLLKETDKAIQFEYIINSLNSKNKEYIINIYKNLDIEVQKQFCIQMIDNNYTNDLLKIIIQESNIEVQKEIINKNYKYLPFFDKSLQIELLSEKPELFNYASLEVQKNVIKENRNFHERINIDKIGGIIETYNYSEIARNQVEFTPLISAKGSLLEITEKNGAYNMREGINQYYDKQIEEISGLEIEDIEELIKKDTNYILPYSTCKTIEEKEQKKANIKLLFSNIIGNENIQIYSELIDLIIDNYNFDGRTNTRCILDELKIIFNKEIVSKNDPELIKKFIEEKIQGNENNELFLKIMENAYGIEAKDIIGSRPNLNEHNINSLEIFDKDIIKFFGIGVIHDLISYNIENMSEFIFLMKDPKTKDAFYAYYTLLTNIYGKNIETLQNAINNFINVKELFKDIDTKELSDDELNQLYNVIINNNFGKITKKDQLINYQNIVKQEFDKKTIGIKDITYIKEMISQMLFGMNYCVKYETLRDKEKLSKLCNINDISNLSDNSLLTDEEKQMIEFANLIHKENDINILIEIINALFENKDILCCDYFISGVKKIINNQEKIVNDSLITREKIEEEIRKQSGKAFYKEIDGVPIYILNGMDYSILRHMICMGTNNELIKGNIDNFYNLEEQYGSSTISTGYIRNLPALLGWELGFSSVPADTLVGIGENYNASTEHASKLVHSSASNGSIDISKLNPEKRSEVAFYRRKRDEDTITNENNGGRIVPDFIITGGDYDPENFTCHGLDEARKYKIPILYINDRAYRAEMVHDIEEIKGRTK